MQAGTLTRRVTIQKEGTIYDELGEPIPGGWVDVATVWADIRNLSGLETIKSNVEVSFVKASIRIRYRAGITAAMRVLYGITIYDIDAVLMDTHDREYIDLICTAMGTTE
ncbi:phage head closure protein [Eoetvoesiella caeni]